MNGKFVIAIAVLTIGCDRPPAPSTTAKQQQTTAAPGDSDHLPGIWGGSTEACGDLPFRIASVSGEDYAYKLQRSKMTCFLRPRPIGINGEQAYSSNCESVNSQKRVDAVRTFGRGPITLIYAPVGEQSEGTEELLQRCPAPR